MREKVSVAPRVVGGRTSWRSGLVGALLFAVSCGSGQAEDLKNFVRDLYGGGGIFLGVTPGAFNHSAHFASASLTQLSNLNQDIVRSVNVSAITPSFPFVSFDVAQGMPSTTQTSLGPVFGERAETIGKGKLSVSASFTHIHYTQFNGQDLSNIPLLLTHQPVPGCTPAGCAFLADDVRLNLKLDITRNIFATYATYGLTDNWDINVVVPLVDQTARASSVATIANNSGTNVHTFDAAHPATSRTGGERFGLGDVIIRTKYNFLRGAESLPDMSVIGQVNIPTGDQANLLGSGSTDIMGALVLSKQLGRVSPHFNIGYQVASGGYDRNNIQYAIGADLSVHRDLTLAADFLGQQYTGAGSQFNETYVSLGGKWRPFGPHVLAASFLIPVNKGTGLRPDYIAFVGYQAVF